jgi:hypothetical protein
MMLRWRFQAILREILEKLFDEKNYFGRLIQRTTTAGARGLGGIVIFRGDAETIDLPCLNRRNKGLKPLVPPRSTNSRSRVSYSTTTGR